MIVSPLLPDDAAAEIDEADLRIDTYRASGAGGQHVNKTDSAVRITHMPTGIVVQCQNERSQTSNKQTALRILRSRLAELEQEQREAELAKERGAVQEADFGSQIRSYVLHPYQLVKDHRTDVEVGNAQGVLDGDLDEFVHAYLLARAAGKGGLAVDSARIDPPPTGAAPGSSARSNGDVPHTLPVQQADELQIETPVALAEAEPRPRRRPRLRLR